MLNESDNPATANQNENNRYEPIPLYRTTNTLKPAPLSNLLSGEENKVKNTSNIHLWHSYIPHSNEELMEDHTIPTLTYSILQKDKEASYAVNKIFRNEFPVVVKTYQGQDSQKVIIDYNKESHFLEVQDANNKNVLLSIPVQQENTELAFHKLCSNCLNPRYNTSNINRFINWRGAAEICSNFYNQLTAVTPNFINSVTDYLWQIEFNISKSHLPLPLGTGMTMEYNPQTKEVLFRNNQYEFKTVKLANNEILSDIFSENNTSKVMQALEELSKTSKYVGGLIPTDNPATTFMKVKKTFCSQKNQLNHLIPQNAYANKLATSNNLLAETQGLHGRREQQNQTRRNHPRCSIL